MNEIEANNYIKEIYIRALEEGPCPELEHLIAINSHYAERYAENVLKGPFPQGEQAIAESARNSYFYANYVLHDRFYKGENSIAQDPGYACYYAINVLKERFLEAEKTIFDSEFAYRYCKEILEIDLASIIKNAIPTVSKIKPVRIGSGKYLTTEQLATHMIGNTLYAVSVVKERSPEAEIVLQQSLPNSMI